MKKLTISLKAKFLLMYFLFIFLPTIILSVMFISSTQKNMRENIEQSADSSFRQTVKLLEYFTSNLNNYMNHFLSIKEFHSILESDNSEKSTKQQIEDMQYLQNLASQYQSYDEISDIILYIDNDAIYIGNTAWTKPLSSAKNSSWYSYASDFSKGCFIPPVSLENPDIVSYVKYIPDSKNYKRNIGIIRFNMQLSSIKKMIAQNTSLDYSVLLYSNDHKLIDYSGAKLPDKYSSILEQALFNEISITSQAKNSFKLFDNNYLCYEKQIQLTDWYLVFLIPYKSITSEIISQSYLYIIIFIFICISGLIFGALFIRLFFKRITRIAKHMSHIKTTLPDPLPVSDNNDELEELVKAYNYMLSRINVLLKEQYLLGNQIKEAEMKALYEQINPHFLYNTLSMITWLAEDGETESITRVIDALSNFYRLSLNKGTETIQLKDELKIIESFVYIQQMRIGSNISLHIDCSERLKSFIIPKLTLQPLVENSLVHGILMKRKKEGNIWISVSEKDEHVVIKIKDDGIGIPDDIQNKLNAGTLVRSDKHYGIYNIMQRLQLFYNHPCTLTYSSVTDKYTEAVLTI